jgi:hypothetical protein
MYRLPYKTLKLLHLCRNFSPIHRRQQYTAQPLENKLIESAHFQMPLHAKIRPQTKNWKRQGFDNSILLST